MLRGLARRLPVLRSYERRIAELTEQISGPRVDGRLAAPMWVPPGHFYSPVPSVEDLHQRADRVFGRDPQDVAGVDLHLDEQWALLDLLEPLAADVDFAASEDEARERGTRYWHVNPAFGAGDALFLTAILRHLAPRQLVELGCGYSSACTLDARDRFLDGELDLTFVDPYPQLLHSLVRPADRETVQILTTSTQDVDVDIVRALGPGDVLFVDSTHCSRTGGDVNRVFFELLPALAPGVLVHVHDIFPAFEYPRDWAFEGRAWNEVYLVRAFLQFNDAFEILLWPGLLANLDHEQMMRRFPQMASNVGGSIWLRKTR
jgi:Methyltransferase domain